MADMWQVGAVLAVMAAGYGLLVWVTRRSEGVPPLHERIVADALRDEADEQMLRRGVCPPDLHDVFKEDGDRD